VIPLWLVITASAVVLSSLSIARHHAFYSLEDTGMFVQMLWATLRGKLFYTNLVNLGLFAWLPHNYLGDHFSLILFLLLPVFAVWPEPELLFVVQSIALALAALPLYLLVQRRFGDRYLALAFAFAWSISPYVWQSNIADFHLDTLEPLLIFFAFYSLFEKRTAPYLTCIGLLLLCREDTALYVVAMGLFAILSVRERTLGTYTIALGVLWATLTFGLFMPWLQAGLVERYPYLEHYSHFGQTFPEILKTFAAQPHRIIAHLLQRPILEAAWWMFFSVVFLPVFSLPGLILLAPSALQKLLTNTAHINTLSWYYSASVLPFFFVAALPGAANILALVKRDRLRRVCRNAIAGLIAAAGLVAAGKLGFGVVGEFKVSLPVPTISDESWLWVTNRDTEIRRMLRSIPHHTSVSANPYVVSHVAKRFDVRVHPYHPLDREVILLDMYGAKYPSDSARDKCAVLTLLSGSEYGVVAYFDGFLYMKRGHDTSRNRPIARQVASLVEDDQLSVQYADRVFDGNAGDKRAVFFASRRRSRAVVYGPYISLAPGRYALSFRMKVGERAAADVARIDVSADSGTRVLIERVLRGDEFQQAGRYEDVGLSLQTDEMLENVEFRVHSRGGTRIWVDRIHLFPERLDLDLVGSWCKR